ncbi:hypothetical protein PCC6912_59010 [Chlorogloeopsis fritschii PCC 6912]|uniref:Uncharacterized protein n=1 Tax=Chlorogloeopsis fritschii PCC 6912 TaxID=211165 RepID=A0A433MXT6_CHLFR|nr:hypothetical protein PCC6912_59010 [Chlorogloeopsis fritschii PCC 6912]
MPINFEVKVEIKHNELTYNRFTKKQIKRRKILEMLFLTALIKSLKSKLMKVLFLALISLISQLVEYKNHVWKIYFKRYSRGFSPSFPD